MIEIAGVAIGALVARLGLAQPPLLRAAVLAQVADLVTFAFIWRSGDGEQNPIGQVALGAALGLLGSRGYGADDRGWIAVVLAGLAMLGLKVALIMFLVRIGRHLGRYRRVVLVAATVVGLAGAVSNVIAFPIPPGPAG